MRRATADSRAETRFRPPASCAGGQGTGRASSRRSPPRTAWAGSVAGWSQARGARWPCSMRTAPRGTDSVRARTEPCSTWSRAARACSSAACSAARARPRRTASPGGAMRRCRPGPFHPRSPRARTRPRARCTSPTNCRPHRTRVSRCSTSRAIAWAWCSTASNRQAGRTWCGPRMRPGSRRACTSHGSRSARTIASCACRGFPEPSRSGGREPGGNTSGAGAYILRPSFRRNTAMSVRSSIAALFVITLPAAALAGPSLTLYTSDLGLVKESRTLDYRGSRDTLRLEGVSDRLDATSLRFGPSSGKLARLAYRFDVATGDGLLEKAIGSRVRVVSKTGERVTEGTLLSADGSWLVVRGDDGALSSLYREAMQEVRLAKPDASLSLKPAIEAVVEGAKKGLGSAELQYLTGGLSWSAEHTLVRTGETSAQWSAVVRVENTTGRDYRDASVKLIAGEVSRAGAPMPMDAAPRAMKTTALAMSVPGYAPSEQAFSDFHLYTLPGVATLRDRESQTLVLLEPKTVGSS